MEGPVGEPERNRGGLAVQEKQVPKPRGGWFLMIFIATNRCFDHHLLIWSQRPTHEVWAMLHQIFAYLKFSWVKWRDEPKWSCIKKNPSFSSEAWLKLFEFPWSFHPRRLEQAAKANARRCSGVTEGTSGGIFWEFDVWNSRRIQIQIHHVDILWVLILLCLEKSSDVNKGCFGWFHHLRFFFRTSWRFRNLRMRKRSKETRQLSPFFWSTFNWIDLMGDLWSRNGRNLWDSTLMKFANAKDFWRSQKMTTHLL